MKKITTIFLILLFSTSSTVSLDTSSAEDIANSILQTKVSITPRVGTSSTSIFLREFEVHLYKSALETEDRRIKALLAIHALKEMPIILKPGQPPPTDLERMEMLNKNPDFQKLKSWYFDLIKE